MPLKLTSILLFFIVGLTITSLQAYYTAKIRFTKDIKTCKLNDINDDMLTSTEDAKVTSTDEDYSNVPLQQLLEQATTFTTDTLPPSLDEAISSKLKLEGIPDWKIRLDIMGFTPLTFAGFALAAVLMTLNGILGTGWASQLLGMNGGNGILSVQSMNGDSATIIRPSVEDPRIAWDKEFPIKTD